MPVTVTLLGGFCAAVDGTTVADTAWRLKKARELVKLLALARGHRLHREQAMDVLWRDRAPAAAANNLHQAVHVARRALGADAIDVRDEVLSLAAEVDVDRSTRPPPGAPRLKTPAAYRARSPSTAASCCRRTATTTGRRRGARSSRRSPPSSRRRWEGLGRRAAFGLPADASSFVGRGRELTELRVAAAANAAAHARRDGRGGQDSAGARARPRRRGVLRGRRCARGARGDRGSAARRRMRSPLRSTCVRSPSRSRSTP